VREHPTAREQDLRDYLGGFDFRGAMADTRVASFSGGEKSRLALALLARRRPNLLLLDEPTNHLDLEMRHALTAALAEFDGSLVLVSHDRALLRAVCDTFVLVADGRATPFDGDLDDYLGWLAARRAAPIAGDSETAAGAGKVARKETLAAAARERQAKLARRRLLLKEAGQLESRLAAWQDDKHRLDTQLADPAFYSGAETDRIREVKQRHHELARLIGEAEHRWLEVQSELEGIGNP
jgi:ATP-binding cassette subfamily F protein 3